MKGSKLEIQELFQGDVEIPTLPEIYYDFKEAMEDPDGSFDRISEIISTDTGLSVRLLKIVNSAFYGFPSQIETISHAISVIGLEQLNNLVLSTVVMDRFKGIPDSVINMESFWKHSIACGLAARVIATHREEVNTERYFVAGMIHDVGRLVIALSAPFSILSVFMRCKSDEIPLHKAEKEVLGFSHTDVGKLLLENWQLPVFHQNVVGNHHTENSTDLESGILNIADHLANDLKLGDSGEASFHSEFNTEIWEKLQLSEGGDLEKIKEEVEQLYNSTSQIFLQTA
ncbi:MAG: HDOD domain-containing protein [Nitrospina sp.]|nr:HDOD domain-containing protein [Nitrospina sp.]